MKTHIVHRVVFKLKIVHNSVIKADKMTRHIVNGAVNNRNGILLVTARIEQTAVGRIGSKRQITKGGVLDIKLSLFGICANAEVTTVFYKTAVERYPQIRFVCTKQTLHHIIGCGIFSVEINILKGYVCLKSEHVCI